MQNIFSILFEKSCRGLLKHTEYQQHTFPALLFCDIGGIRKNYSGSKKAIAGEEFIVLLFFIP